jgi:pyrroline-5-carboxylate reductase
MKLAIVGCGNMGMIYARAFLKYDLVTPDQLMLVEKNASRQAALAQRGTGNVIVAGDPAIAAADLIILAVKPQDFPAVAGILRPVLRPDNTILSVMAGITMQRISGLLGCPSVIRAMPNSPAELGMGMTAFTAGAHVPSERVRLAENLLATTGRTVFFADEALLDAVTALSGSGPAYFFYVVKSMVEAGRQMGFDEATATLLVRQTMLGAFHLINNAGKPLDELIRDVASKGGTTEAAFRVFTENGLGETIREALLRARDRSRELAGNS